MPVIRVRVDCDREEKINIELGLIDAAEAGRIVDRLKAVCYEERREGKRKGNGNGKGRKDRS